jgi:hypothetical protein
MHILSYLKDILFQPVDCIVIAIEDLFKELWQVLLGLSLIEELLLDVFMTHINDVFKFFNASTHTQE